MPVEVGKEGADSHSTGAPQSSGRQRPGRIPISKIIIKRSIQFRSLVKIQRSCANCDADVILKISLTGNNFVSWVIGNLCISETHRSITARLESRIIQQAS